MIRFSAAIVPGLMVLFGIQIPSATSDDDRKAETRPDVYHAWWLASLTNPDEPKNGYYRLLITRGPLVPLAGQKQKDRRPAASALDAMAFTFLTYKKDSFYSHSGNDAFRPVQEFGSLDEKRRTLVLDGTRYTYELCPIADVIRLLENPEGKLPVHRLHTPLDGAEQTARAFRLLLTAEQSPSN